MHKTYCILKIEALMHTLSRIWAEHNANGKQNGLTTHGIDECLKERADSSSMPASSRQVGTQLKEKNTRKEGNERARVDPGCIAMISSKWQIELVSREDSGWAVAAAVRQGE